MSMNSPLEKISQTYTLTPLVTFELFDVVDLELCSPYDLPDIAFNSVCHLLLLSVDVYLMQVC